MMNLLDNDILTLASVKDMVEYASEMRLNFDCTNEQNNGDLMETEQNVGSPANLSETEEVVDEDIRNNMVLQINIVERDDEVLSEDEVNTFQEIGDSQNVDGSLRVNENYESQLTNRSGLNCLELNSRAELRSPSNFASLESYPISMPNDAYVTNRSAPPRSDHPMVDYSASEDSGLEYSDREASYSEHSQRQFFSCEEQLLLNKNRFFARADNYSPSKEMEIDLHGGVDRLFHSV